MKTCFLLYFLLLVSVVLLPNRVISRPQPSNGSTDRISDGVDGFEEAQNTFSVIGLRRSVASNSEESCEQMYGFLPCSKSIPGHVFLILVYEYLLFHGESYVAGGGERIFKILGPGVFGACAFQIIGSFPEALILLVSGLLNNKEVAQECVLTGVGLLAGSSILLLTLVWGTCVILGSQHFPVSSQQSSDCTNQNPIRTFFLSLWPGYGVVTDSWTGYTARIMLVSAFPFTIIQFPVLFNLSYFWERIFVVVALVVSVTFLLSYFFYQLFQPWIQGRQLLYLKHGHLVVDILKHVQNHTNETLFTDDGAPNLSVIRRIFKETDRDGDESLDAAEIKGFLRDIKFRKIYSGKDKATEDMMKEFDVDSNKKININEFVEGMGKWVTEIKKDSGQTYLSDEENSTQASLLTEDETPNPDEVKDSDYHQNWEETDKLVESKFVDKSILAWIKAISLLVIGIVMLGLLAEPLIHSVQSLSTAANIPSFFIAFIFVPLATNARITISAISEVRRKKLNVTSLTFSEIYGTVLMNNLLGFSVLLSLIYFRGFSWDFSVEVLMVLIVSVVMGCLASFSTVFPVWTAVFAYMLYPLSLVLVTVLGNFNWLS